jgi:hypothetical protein
VGLLGREIFQTCHSAITNLSLDTTSKHLDDTIPHELEVSRVDLCMGVATKACVTIHANKSQIVAKGVATRCENVMQSDTLKLSPRVEQDMLISTGDDSSVPSRELENVRGAIKSMDLGLAHRRARLVLPYQARFKIWSCLISNSSKNQEFIQTTSQFQAISENLKSQNLNFKQDPRI